jgi:hypothetical protein
MRELMVQEVAAVELQDGANVMVNDQDWPASRILFGRIVTDPFPATVPTGDVVTPQPAGGAGIVTDRRATDVAPKSAGTRIVQVSTPCCVRTIDRGDWGLHDIVTRLRSAVTSRAPIVVEPVLQLPPGLHICREITEVTFAPGTPPVVGARSDTVKEVVFAGAV